MRRTTLMNAPRTTLSLLGILALLTLSIDAAHGEDKSRDDKGYFQEETGSPADIEKEFEAERKAKEPEPEKVKEKPTGGKQPEKPDTPQKPEKELEKPKEPVKIPSKEPSSQPAKEKERETRKSSTEAQPQEVQPREQNQGPRSASQGPGYQLDIIAAADTLGAWDKGTPKQTTNDYRVREAELGFIAAVDQLATGQVLAAAHQEDGQMKFELHEAYLFFPQTFIPNTSIKMGQFFYDVGRLNSIHRHDWPFPVAPVVHRELLADEAASDAGVQFQTLMPWSFWQELSVGVFNGKTVGEADMDGPAKRNPLVTAHLKQFLPLWWDGWGAQFGFSYMRWSPNANPYSVTQQSGADLVVKWKRGKLASFQWLSEVWYRETRERRQGALAPAAPPVDTRVGGYSFIEYQVAEQWFLGTRFDYFTDPNKRGALGYTVRNGTAEEALLITYKPSEFSFFRVQATRSTDIQTGVRDYLAYFQATFIIGKHPAHVY
ncbi:MAG: hypothetical protein HY042_01320 [Spirochaetia bacterium]|nr:hypothetical protein [Spirochaetia bacterium]